MVRWSIGSSDGQSVGPSVREHESKSGKMSVLKIFVYVSMLKRVLGGELGRVLGVDGGWLPPPTHLQQYCDPAPLVYLRQPLALVISNKALAFPHQTGVAVNPVFLMA